ncbi:hypothetical protein GBF38_017021 [Nibea albiflora]|uniref:Uncharacterized protein n=1 Tax=Nibea albiflora TaxID=240163 RepID=A0ACB7EFH7_NIBAL|nr:hypothetical protein GBF38_017021 [Nibea albiflora]
MAMMRDVMWIYALFILLIAEAWGTDTAVRNVTFNLGSDANLTCSDKTWNETIYVIWKINLKNSAECRMSFTNEGQSDDLCNDGKSLRNSSEAQPYLHIPNFSNNDVGIYKCESVFKGGNENYKINVAITVRPILSAWLERENNKRVAVCMAERGKPAANISWSHTGNSSSVQTLTESHGFFTVTENVEEVEPYASYVQRVNSIYNSSADLFT